MQSVESASRARRGAGPGPLWIRPSGIAALLAAALTLPAAPATARLLFSNGAPVPLAPRPELLAVADLDADGRDDLVAVSPSSGKVQVLLGRASANAVFDGIQVYAEGRKLRGLALADLDGDGAIDIAVADESSRGVWIWPGRGDGSFATATFVAVSGRPFALATGDFDAAKGADLVVGDRRSGTVTVWMNLGERRVAFRRGPALDVGDGVEQVASGDLDGDGADDIVCRRDGGRRGNELVAVYRQGLQAGTPTFAEPLHLPTGIGAARMDVGDLDGDAQADVALLTYAQAVRVNTLDVMRSTPGRSFAPTATRVLECPTDRRLGRCRAQGMAAADFDGDGRLDVAVAQRVPRRGGHHRDEVVAVLRARGDGAFVAGGFSAGPRHPLAAASGDFNGDGRSDIAVTGRDNTVRALLNITAPADTPLGDPCLLGDECASGLCANGVCCSSPCSADQRCDLPGSQGTCSAP